MGININLIARGQKKKKEKIILRKHIILLYLLDKKKKCIEETKPRQLNYVYVYNIVVNRLPLFGFLVNYHVCIINICIIIVDYR